MKKLMLLGLLMSGMVATTYAQEGIKVVKSTTEHIRKDVKHVRVAGDSTKHKTGGRRMAHKPGEFRNDHRGVHVLRTPEEIAKLRTDKLTGKLSLTDKQQKDVYAIELKSAKTQAQHRDLLNKQREEMKKERQQSNDALKKVLTADQNNLLKKDSTTVKKRPAPRTELKK